MSIDRKFFTSETVASARTLITEGTEIEGGILKCCKGTKIDGKLSGTKVVSMDGSPIHISPTADLDSVFIDGADLLIEGKVTGEIRSTGRTEFAAGCTVVGNFYKGSEVYMHMLSDLEDLVMKRSVHATAPQSVHSAEIIGLNNNVATGTFGQD